MKKSLQLMVSMLNLQAGAEREVELQLHETSARLAAIARAHELYQGARVQEIELGNISRLYARISLMW